MTIDRLLLTVGESILAAIVIVFGGLMLLVGLVGFFFLSEDIFAYVIFSCILAVAATSLTVGVYICFLSEKRKRRTSAQLQQARKQAEQQAKQLQIAKSHEQGEAAVHRIESILNSLVNEHKNALSVQYRKLTHTDAYGNIILDRWEGELEYFRRTIIEPALSPEDCGEATVHIWLELDKDVQLAVCELHGEDGAALKYFETYLDSTIDKLVQNLVSTHPNETDVNMDEVSPSDFERLCADYLKSAGWNTQVSAGSGDQGVDIVARNGDTVAVFQCKLYSKPLGNTPVQEVFTGKQFYKAQIAAVVTNADYTPGARAAAKQTGVLLFHYSELGTFTPPNIST